MFSSSKLVAQEPSKRAVLFSFPPTQRSGLLDSTALSDSSRSKNQQANFKASCKKMLDCLSAQPLALTEAF